MVLRAFLHHPTVSVNGEVPAEILLGSNSSNLEGAVVIARERRLL